MKMGGAWFKFIKNYKMMAAEPENKLWGLSERRVCVGAGSQPRDPKPGADSDAAPVWLGMGRANWRAGQTCSLFGLGVEGKSSLGHLLPRGQRLPQEGMSIPGLEVASVQAGGTGKRLPGLLRHSPCSQVAVSCGPRRESVVPLLPIRGSLSGACGEMQRGPSRAMTGAPNSSLTFPPCHRLEVGG